MKHYKSINECENIKFFIVKSVLVKEDCFLYSKVSGGSRESLDRGRVVGERRDHQLIQDTPQTAGLVTCNHGIPIIIIIRYIEI